MKVSNDPGFADEDGDLFDPATVTCKVQKPSDAAGTLTTFTYGTDAELEKDSTGVYHVWIDADETGTWVYGFRGEDVDGNAVENSSTFDVETDFR